MSIDWNWGYSCNRPLRQHYLPGWLWSGFQITVALSISARIIAFLVGSLFGILRTVPNRFLSGIGTCYVELFRNVPLIVQFFTRYRWCQSSCRKISACGLNRSWTQTFNSLSPPCCARAVYRRSRLRAGTRRHPVAAARAEERRPGDGPDPAANLPLRATAERLPRYCAADDLGDDEPGEKLGHRLHHRSGRYGRAGGQTAGLLRSCPESFTAITTPMFSSTR